MNYFYEILSLARLAGTDVAATITYRVDGPPSSTQFKNFMYEATTIHDFKSKLKTYEIMMNKNPDQNQTLPKLRYQNCGDVHRTADCPFKEKGKKCSKCNDLGHMGSSCMHIQCPLKTVLWKVFLRKIYTTEKRFYMKTHSDVFLVLIRMSHCF